jgi:Na+-transporting NADH:ubiquinone oxidoreductase subunit NqrD
MAQKSAVILGMIVSVIVVYGLLTEIVDIAKITIPNNVDMVVQWAIIIGGVLLYRKLRHK